MSSRPARQAESWGPSRLVFVDKDKEEPGTQVASKELGSTVKWGTIDPNTTSWQNVQGSTSLAHSWQEALEIVNRATKRCLPRNKNFFPFNPLTLRV